MKYNQNFKINQVDEATLVVGIDIGSREHYVRAFDWRGRELAKTFSFSNTLSGFEAFNSWIQAICTREEKTKTVAGIEPTGHFGLI
ncbi:transposase [Marinisporobacter balticus]|uniref:Transposase n=1 Tax=Marinisporobacter balticus TaxID=2018667 RepID=A0A4R2K7X3_9FIRM|nr:transposase [Marinisporobacter balticus]